jgi:hypothetical protein
MQGVRAGGAEIVDNTNHVFVEIPRFTLTINRRLDRLVTLSVRRFDGTLKMTPLNPYKLIYHLLVDHLRAMTYQGRMTWLEQGNLHDLLAQVAPEQPTIVFVPDLLTAAYHHDGKSDAGLRQLLVHLRAAYQGHQDLYKEIGLLLQEGDVGWVLFPQGASKPR